MTANNDLKLPPYISGQQKGWLDLLITEICWKINNYNTVETRVLWWGDDYKSSAVRVLNLVEPPKIAPPIQIKYKINTNLKLFELYLNTAESIEIKISTVRTHSLIGTVFIAIPDNLLTKKEIVLSENIFSPRNNILGSLKVIFKINFDTTIDKEKTSLCIEKENTSPVELNISPTVNFNEISANNFCTFNPLISLSTQRNTSSKQSSRSFSDLDQTSRSIVLNYLGGQKMSNEMENQALAEIVSISPPDSLIEAIVDTQKIENLIISIEMKNLSLTQEAIQKLEKNANFKYIFDVTCQNIRFQSSEITNLHKNIEFKLNGIQQLKVPNTLEIVEFEINCKNHFYEYYHFGSATIAIKDLKKNKKYNKKYFIREQTNLNLIQGRMNIQIEIKDEILTECPYSNYATKIVSDNETFTSVPSTSLHLRSTSNNGNVKIKNELLQKRVNTLENSVNQMEILEGIIYIGNLGGIVTPENAYFIVIHSFWRNTICTQIANDYSFNFIDAFSIIRNCDLIERTKNNFLVLELWQKGFGTSEKLIGNILIPLQKFYVALCDLKILQHLKQSKLPLTAIDGWTSILSPLSHEVVGQLDVILAVGSKEQIDYLKNSRNLGPNKIFNQCPTNAAMAQILANSSENKTVGMQTSLHSEGDCSPNANAISEYSGQNNSRKFPKVNSKISTPSNIINLLNQALLQPSSSLPVTPNYQSLLTEQCVLPILNNHASEDGNLRLKIEVLHSLNLSESTNLNPEFLNDKRSKIYIIIKNLPDCKIISVEDTYNTIWNNTFEVILPIKFLLNLDKMLEIQVFQSNPTKSLEIDTEIGIASINLAALIKESLIEEYFCILDCTGKTNGKIKIKFQTTEDLARCKRILINYCDDTILSENDKVNGSQIRKTSDLLNMLNTALLQTSPLMSCSQATDKTADCSLLSSNLGNIERDGDSYQNFNATIEIEHAIEIPKAVIRTGKKMCNHKRGKKKIFRTPEPNTYISFKAMQPVLQSTNFTTNIVEQNCNPIWNQKFDIALPIEFLKNSEKLFEICTFTQINPTNNSADTSDKILGKSKINLTALLSRSALIDDYFNIIDDCGKINGKIKIKIKLKEDVDRFKEHKSHNLKSTKSDFDFMSTDESNDSTNMSLSRALKRKFSELEEITERLKTRLNDVTSNDLDEFVDDEFESYLNTEAIEDDNHYNWPSDNIKYENIASQFHQNLQIAHNNAIATNIYSSSPSTSSSSISNDRVKVIAEALKKTFIDEAYDKNNIK